MSNGDSVCGCEGEDCYRYYTNVRKLMEEFFYSSSSIRLNDVMLLYSQGYVFVLFCMLCHRNSLLEKWSAVMHVYHVQR